MAWQGGSHASRAAGPEGSLGKGQMAGEKGRGSEAETGEGWGGGFWGHGRQQRLEEPITRHRAMELHSCGCGGGGGGRDPRGGRGGGANASEARERCVPGLRRSAGAGRQDGAAARAPHAWIPEPSLGGTGAAGVPPSSPTLLFRRWVRKVESLISQPMTSGKNELQDHLIFISEKALHKRSWLLCLPG
eukprot:XP_006518327.1 PREDICTED: putative cryptochrome DASH, mitochondrial isoform X5 [Mus musculus]